MAIGTYNARTLARDEDLDLLLEEKRKIRCDVPGVCETRGKKEKEVIWNDGHTIYLGKGEGASNVGGVGFIVNNEWSANIESCSIISSRVGILLMKLDSEMTIKFIEVYAPTSASEDREIEEFYQCLDRALTTRSTYTVLMGDFNAKVGRKKDGERFVGKYGIGERNERGERLVAWAESMEMFIANTWYKKKPKRRWTWISPNAEKKNEIDYILTNRLRILQDVTVVPSFNTGSDHRLVKAKLIFEKRRERRALHKANRRKQKVEFDEEVFQNLVSRKKWEYSGRQAKITITSFPSCKSAQTFPGKRLQTAEKEESRKKRGS